MTAIITNSQAIQIRDEHAKETLPLAAGDVIEAEVMSEEEGRLTLKTGEGFVFSADAAEVKGEVSDKLSFEVVAAEAGKLSLKQILPAAEKKEAPTEEKLAQVLKKISVKVTEESKNAVKTLLENNMEIQKESVKAIMRIKKTVGYIASNITEEAVAELEKSGFSAEKLTLDVLKSVLKETGSNRDKPLGGKPEERLSSEELSRLVDKYVKKEKISEKELTDKAEIIKKLQEAEMPVTEKNIALVETALSRYEGLEKLNGEAVAALIEGGREITVESAYIASHSSKPKTKQNQSQKKVSDELWHKLLPEVKKTFEREQIKDTSENTVAARFLLENEIPLTKENIEKYEMLHDGEKQIPKREVIEKAVENIKKGLPVAKIPLAPEAHAPEKSVSPEQAAAIEKENERIIEELPRIIADEEVIEITIAERGGKTVESFRKTYKKKRDEPREYQRDLERIEKREKTESDAVKDDRKASVVRAKRQLAEIQLKMTKEASARLAGKGVEIDTLPLEQAIEELKQAEKELYSSELAKADAPVTEENVERMAEVFDKVRLLQPASWRAYEAVVAGKAEFTIREVADANARAREELSLRETDRPREAAREREVSRSRDISHRREVSPSREIFKDIETFATAPIAKFGDSLEKVLNEQIPELLTKLEIEPSEQNIRAAKILSRAQIDVTAESVADVKIVDQKLQAITNRLHPTIAANMIKEGLNPLDMHVDEVNAYIDGYQDAYGDNLRDKISKYIVEMDDNKELPPREREAMIAVYRLLNAAQKNESVAVGLALKSDAELTLGNLMEAAKYYKRTGGRKEDVNVRIDDQFGTLQKLTVKKGSIRQIFNENKSAAALEAEQSLKTAEIETTKDNIRAALRLAEKNMPVTEENLREEKAVMAQEKRAIPARAEAPERREQPQAPERAETPERREQPQVTERPETPERREQPQAPERPETPERREQPQAPERAEAPERREQPQAPERAEAPERREQPQAPERAETPERREQPQVTERPETPERREQPQAPERPEAAAAGQAAEVPERRLEQNPFRYVPENTQALIPAPKEELLSTAVTVLKNLGLATEPAAAVASAEKILTAAGLIMNRENLTKAIETQTLVKRLVTEVSPEALGDIVRSDGGASDKTAAEVLRKTDERKNLRRSTQRTAFRQNAYTETERPLKPVERQELEKVSAAVEEIRKHEEAVTTFALKTNAQLQTKTLPEIADFVQTAAERPRRPAVSEALAAEYEELVNELDADVKAKAETLLKENNLGKTPDNLRLAQFVLAGTETYEDLNQDAVRQIIQNSLLMEEFIEDAIPEKLQKLVKEQLESPKSATIQTLLGEIRNEQDTKHRGFERARTENYVEKLRQISEISPASIRFMEKNNIPLTMNNMQAMQSLVKNSFGLGKTLGSLKEKEEERGILEESDETQLVDEVLDTIPDSSLGSLASGEGSPENLLDELYRRLENLGDASDSREIIEQVKNIQSGLAIQKKSGSLKLPVKINGNLTDLNVYVINDISGKEEVKAFISLKTKSLGTVQIDVNLQGVKADLSVNSDKAEAAEFLGKNADLLNSLLTEIGCEIGDLRYGTAEERNLISEEVSGEENFGKPNGAAFEAKV